MLRLKRSVMAKFDTRVNVLDADAIKRIQEQIARESKEPEKKKVEQVVSTVDEITYSAPPVANEQEIDLDELEESEEGAEDTEAAKKRTREKEDDDDDVRVVQQKVPAAVFGSIAPEKERLDQEEQKKKRRK